MNECCICLEDISKENDIRLTCCSNIIHKNCFDLVMEKYLNCPLCQEMILLHLPNISFFTKIKYYKKKKIFIKSQDNMIYFY
jgi:hypothetical protein